jgi:hypothetical protein
MIYGFTPADITKHEYEASEALYNNKMMVQKYFQWNLPPVRFDAFERSCGSFGSATKYYRVTETFAPSSGCQC